MDQVRTTQMQLQPEETLSAGIKRMALALHAHTLTVLKGALGKEHEAVHTVRKNLKEMRALLRLARGALGKETYLLENRFYRNLGREISVIRDATSVVEALDKLKEAGEKEVPDDAYLKLKEALLRKRGILVEDVLQGQHMLPQLQEKLRKGRERVAGWTLQEQGFDTVKPGFRKVYEQGYALMAKAEKEPSSGNLHEWRKQAKYLMYHTRIFVPLWPEVLEPLASEINLLTDYLGDDHDLSLLDQQRGAVLHGQENSLFESLIHHRRKSLTELAFLQGKRIYALNPYAYADQLEAWWDAWTGEKKTYTRVPGT